MTTPIGFVNHEVHNETEEIAGNTEIIELIIYRHLSRNQIKRGFKIKTPVLSDLRQHQKSLLINENCSHSIKPVFYYLMKPAFRSTGYVRETGACGSFFLFLCSSIHRGKFHQISFDEIVDFTIHHTVYIRCLIVGAVIFHTAIIKHITADL